MEDRMKLLGRLILSFVSNLIALVAAAYLVSGFDLDYEVANLAMVAGLFTVINFFVKPIIRTLLSPLVILTFGLFTLVINAGMLYILDILSEDITISGLVPLIYATLIVSVINIVINLSARLSYK